MRFTKELRDVLELTVDNLVNEGFAKNKTDAVNKLADALTRSYIYDEIAGHAKFLDESESEE